MYFRAPASATTAVTVDRSTGPRREPEPALATAIALLLVLGIGILPGRVVDVSDAAGAAVSANGIADVADEQAAAFADAPQEPSVAVKTRVQ
jgi:hypothetical protein